MQTGAAVDGEDREYFELWLTHELDLAYRRFLAAQKALDANAAAKGLHRSGFRIRKAVEIFAPRDFVCGRSGISKIWYGCE